MSANAEMKCKMKICRDIIRAMPVIIQSGEAFLNKCNAQKFDFGSSHERVIELAEEAVGAARNRLYVYRNVRSMAGSSSRYSAGKSRQLTREVRYDIIRCMKKQTTAM